MRVWQVTIRTRPVMAGFLSLISRAGGLPYWADSRVCHGSVNRAFSFRLADCESYALRRGLWEQGNEAGRRDVGRYIGAQDSFGVSTSMARSISISDSKRTYRAARSPTDEPVRPMMLMPASESTWAMSTARRGRFGAVMRSV